MPAFFAHGAVVSFGGVEVRGLTSISLPDQSKGDVQITNNASAGDHEYLPGLREGGTVTLEGLMIPEDYGQNAIRENYDADDETEEVIITLPPAAAASPVTYTFTSYASALGGDLPQNSDDPGTFNATLKVASKVVKA